MKTFSIITILILLILSQQGFAEQIKLGIVKYRGGDWYSVKGAVRHFISRVNELTPLSIAPEPDDVDLKDRVKLFSRPFLILNGHGKILLDKYELKNLRTYLENGGFLLANDDYGMDTSFRKALADLYPELKWFSKGKFPPKINYQIKSSNKVVITELTKNFPLFSSYYKFNAVPKIHKHDNKIATAYGLFIEKRLVLMYLFNADIMDGWEPKQVHKDPDNVRKSAIQFGINILYYVLSN